MDIINKLKNRSFLMIIRVKTDDLKFPVVIPIPLAFVEDLITSVCWLGTWGLKIFPNLGSNLSKIPVSFDINYAEILEALVEMIRELQYLGRFTLVDIKDESVRVSIKIH